MSHYARARIRALSGTNRIFSASHPFWGEAIRLRQNYRSYTYIVERAHVLGYTDITIPVLRSGFAYAQSVELLPGKGGDYLRRRYAELAEDFDAAATLKFFIQDVISELADIDEALNENDFADPELFQNLLKRRDEIRTLGYSWTREFVEIQTRTETARFEREAPPQQLPQFSIHNYLDTVITDFKQRIAPPPVESVVEHYGAENVRFPIREALSAPDSVDNA